MKYFSSAVSSSVKNTFKFDAKTIKIIALVGGGLYLIMQTIFLLIFMISFPGFYDDGGSFS
jgi:hypothetical protein